MSGFRESGCYGEGGRPGSLYIIIIICDIIALTLPGAPGTRWIWLMGLWAYSFLVHRSSACHIRGQARRLHEPSSLWPSNINLGADFGDHIVSVIDDGSCGLTMPGASVVLHGDHIMSGHAGSASGLYMGS